MKYLTNFNTLLEYKDSVIIDVPNVSYIINDALVKYNEYPKYNNLYILYTSKDGNKITPALYDFGGSKILNNTYNKVGLIYFDTPIMYIGDNVFRDRLTLTSITLPDSVLEIGANAFTSCANLTQVNYIGNIESWCKINFTSSSSNPTNNSCALYIDGHLVKNLVIPNTIENIKKFAFRGCTSLTSVTIPDSVKSIGEYAFSSCSKLTSATIGNSVMSIGDNAFNSCYSITSITIPNSITSIGEWVFGHCRVLTSIVIGNGVTNIGEYALYGCSKLTSITCTAMIPPILGSNNNLSNVTTVYVPAESVNAYQVADEWSYYADKILPIQ